MFNGNHRSSSDIVHDEDLESAIVAKERVNAGEKIRRETQAKIRVGR